MGYSFVGFLGLMTLLIESHDVLFYPETGKKNRALEVYRKFLYAVLGYYVSDILWGLLSAAGFVQLLFLDTVVYYLTMALGVYLWTQYVAAYLNEESPFSRAICFTGQLLLCGVFGVIAINFMQPVLFWFDDAGTYHACPLRYVFLAVQILLYFLSSVYTFSVVLRTTEGERKRYRTIALFGIIMSGLLTFQYLHPLLPLYSAGYLLGVCLLHSFVLGDEKEEYKRELEESLVREKQQREDLRSAWELAYTDPLTGVKSKLAYVEMKEKKDAAIENGEVPDFGLAVFDLNNLKEINDRKGHEIGDHYIISAAKMIRDCFRHSPVYRVGGDEFCVLLEGMDYQTRLELMNLFNEGIADQIRKNGVVVSGGMADYRRGWDKSCDDVFERADQQMFVRKRELKMA